MARRVYTKRQAAVKAGYRSGLEEDLDNTLKARGVDGEYEKHKINYTKPATNHTYTPDFRLPRGRAGTCLAVVLRRLGCSKTLLRL